MAELDVVDDGAIVIGGDGLIHDVGSYASLKTNHPHAAVHEIEGVVFPGFVDCHTHAVFGGARLADHERRARGVSYKEIAALGGGILASVRDVRSRSVAELATLTAHRLEHVRAHGTTMVEVKSGYGLSLDAEVAQLTALRQLPHADLPTVVPTFLGAHEVPPEYRPHADEYLDVVVREMLPLVATQSLARFCDVFCEPGVFSTEQSNRVLLAAREHGLGLKLHADELDGSGGAELAARLGAVSADHLAAISETGIAALARSETIAVLLPGTMLFLGSRTQAPARKLIDAGAAVALATDFNPGSSPGMSLPLMTTLAVSQMAMVPAEAIIAITVNGAAAVGEVTRCGQIAPGFRADLTVISARAWQELPYWYGVNLVSQVWIAGAPCPSTQASLNCLG